MQLVRPKMTRTTYQALKRYIMREREKKKQEQEQDKEQERLKKERELKKKKEQEDSLTLEQTKDQIFQLEEKLKALKQQKHEMFQQLKKVLNQESEMKQRAQVKEQNEMAAWQQQFHNPGLGPITGPSQSLFLQRHIKYMNVPVSGSQGVKRSRSPSPSPSAPYQHYGTQLQMAPGQYNPSTIKAEPYSSSASEYGGKMVKTEPSPYQPGHGYQQQQLAQPIPSYQPASQSPAGKYQAVGPSAFSSYAGHYPPHQQKPSVPEQYQPNYPRQPIQRRQQQPVSSYMPTSNLPIQQQLEHANQKSGFPDDKMKLQQAMLVAQGQPPPPSQKGSIMSGYPVVAPPPQQVPSSAYNPAANPGSLAPPRHGYGQSRQY